MNEIFQGLGKLFVENIETVRECLREAVRQRDDFIEKIKEELPSPTFEFAKWGTDKEQVLEMGFHRFLAVWKRGNPQRKVLVDLSFYSLNQKEIPLFWADVGARQQIFRRKRKYDKVNVEKSENLIKELADKIKKGLNTNTLLPQ
jgi:hypothetical protein